MTNVAQTSHTVEARSTAAVPTRFAKVLQLWPAVVIGFGIILTIAWTGSLSWLLVSLLRL
jgi:hypothetical protein